MSNFIVSARKYRPTTFENLVGQFSVTETLINAISSGKLAQSFLFCGPRGVGKTTCARIFAKAINQFNSESDIDDFSYNIFELDAASNNSVDDIRKLVDQVRFPPQIGKYKVYIIDEVHMLSLQAFNAFLKTLEEPPKHAKFILATTEKQKIIPTILSRCQIFDFQRIGINDIVKHLEFISKEEDIKTDTSSLNLIAEKADGSMRDALSIFDRLVSFGKNTLSNAMVMEQLNILDYDHYFSITDSLFKNDISSALNKFNNILEKGFDGQHFINGLSDHLRDLLVSKDQVTIQLLNKSEGLKEKYLLQSELCTTNFLLKSLDFCNDCDLNYRLTYNKRLLVELCLIRIASLDKNSSEKKNISEEFNVIDLKQDITEEKENDKNIITDSIPDKLLSDNLGEKPIEQPDKIEEEVVKKQVLVNNDKVKESTARSRTLSISDTAVDSEIIDVVALKRESFSQKELINVWGDMITMLNKDTKTNLAIALNTDVPNLKSDYEIEILLSNQSHIEMIKEDQYLWLDFLKDKLQNDYIKFTTKLQQIKKTNVPYTNKEKFNKMKEDNPNLEKLRKALGLDPDY